MVPCWKNSRLSSHCIPGSIPAICAICTSAYGIAGIGPSVRFRGRKWPLWSGKRQTTAGRSDSPEKREKLWIWVLIIIWDSPKMMALVRKQQFQQFDNTESESAAVDRNTVSPKVFFYGTFNHKYASKNIFCWIFLHETKEFFLFFILVSIFWKFPAKF